MKKTMWKKKQHLLTKGMRRKQMSRKRAHLLAKGMWQMSHKGLVGQVPGELHQPHHHQSQDPLSKGQRPWIQCQNQSLKAPGSWSRTRTPEWQWTGTMWWRWMMWSNTTPLQLCKHCCSVAARCSWCASVAPTDNMRCTRSWGSCPWSSLVSSTLEPELGQQERLPGVPKIT